MRRDISFQNSCHFYFVLSLHLGRSSWNAWTLRRPERPKQKTGQIAIRASPGFAYSRHVDCVIQHRNSSQITRRKSQTQALLDIQDAAPFLFQVAGTLVSGTGGCDCLQSTVSSKEQVDERNSLLSHNLRQLPFAKTSTRRADKSSPVQRVAAKAPFECNSANANTAAR